MPAAEDCQGARLQTDGTQLVLSFSSGHHFHSVFSAPHFMLSQAPFQRRKSVLKQERLPSSAMVLHIRILGFGSIEWLSSEQTIMIHQNKTRIPLQTVMQGVLVWRQVPTPAACNPGMGCEKELSQLLLAPASCSPAPHLWTGVSNLAAVPTHSILGSQQDTENISGSFISK